MLHKDVIPLIAIDLDLNSLNKLCQTSKNFNKYICQSSTFWRQKLLKEFPNIDVKHVKETKKLYEYLISKAELIHTRISKYLKDYNEDTFFQKSKLINDLLIRYDLKKGDVIIFDEIPKEKYIWTGSDFEIHGRTKHPILSEVFSFPDFPPKYWNGIIDLEYISIPYKKAVDAMNNKYLTGKFDERYSLLGKHTTLYEHDPIYGEFINYNVEIF